MQVVHARFNADIEQTRLRYPQLATCFSSFGGYETAARLALVKTDQPAIVAAEAQRLWHARPQNSDGFARLVAEQAHALAWQTLVCFSVIDTPKQAKAITAQIDAVAQASPTSLLSSVSTLSLLIPVTASPKQQVDTKSLLAATHAFSSKPGGPLYYRDQPTRLFSPHPFVSSHSAPFFELVMHVSQL